MYLLTRGHLWRVSFRQDPPNLDMFSGTSTLEIFQCTLTFRSAFNYATFDFTGISKSSSIKKAVNLVFELLLKRPFPQAMLLNYLKKLGNSEQLCLRKIVLTEVNTP